MTTFDERETAFESKFAHDQEMQFRAEARRNRLLGLWAAEMMGMSGQTAEAYAKEVIKSDFEEPGDEDVFRKVSGDFAERGVEMAEADLRAKMRSLMSEAKSALLTESE